MDADDALRYNQYWDDVAKGLYNNPYGGKLSLDEISRMQCGFDKIAQKNWEYELGLDRYNNRILDYHNENAIKGGKGSVKSGINQIEPYSGVKQASQFLKEQGFSRNQRVEYLQSFDVRTIYMDVADADTYGIRFHDFGENAYPKGRYLYETFSNLSTREGAAIKQSWNNMTGIKQWKVQEGTTIIKGKAASQIENGYKYQGGVEQWFISNTKYLQEP